MYRRRISILGWVFFISVGFINGGQAQESAPERGRGVGWQ